MKRHINNRLLAWKSSDSRKPLLIRGARQVGKTYIVREIGRSFDHFMEINFELIPAARAIFEKDLLPDRIVRDLSLLVGEAIKPGKTLLLLDEIQDAPKAIQSLRYFYEKLPQLHVIAAGSLLDFELERIGMPVGRVESLYLYPLTFLEFLEASGRALLVEEILTHDIKEKLSDPIHEELLHILGEYFAVGGMPEAVQSWISYHDLKQCVQIHRSIIETYQQDFGKYAQKYQIKYLDLVFNQVPRLLARRFVYGHISGEYRSRELRPALALLLKAGVSHNVIQSSGSGIPLGADAKPDKYKVLFLDIALAQTLLGVETQSWILAPLTRFANKGPITEAFVGQEMLGYLPHDMKSQLYYWHRGARSSHAEIDYLVQKGEHIYPIEVKSGAPGTLRSLRQYLAGHSQTPHGIRFSALNYDISGDIHNYPLYAVAKVIQPAR